ncbi:hypothetical protein FJR11_06340 [Anabaena sp. UHCC 0187]|uniref:hypothetical protein n=1 Tax=Anabaena sp. UHCC 0187 TaxID=2590018 RepID=UPI001444D749|nr:hypothetical protein [Anabaena sp. UHCC 0187]MTJ12220.1 hypothetical protein [Anabaena sp. UHCC 0187]
MPVHCQAGDIARVTFPDGSILNFADTPINITCENNFNQCTLCTIRIRYSRWDSATGTETVERNLYHRWTIDGIRINPLNNKEIQIKSRGGEYDGCPTLEWRFVNMSIAVSRPWYFTKVEILSISGTSTGKLIKVSNTANDLLFSGNFANCNYSVQCVSGCPPNSLDCGDCCLDCAEIFNGISAIRKILAGIK